MEVDIQGLITHYFLRIGWARFDSFVRQEFEFSTNFNFTFFQIFVRTKILIVESFDSYVTLRNETRYDFNDYSIFWHFAQFDSSTSSSLYTSYAHVHDFDLTTRVSRKYRNINSRNSFSSLEAILYRIIFSILQRFDVFQSRWIFVRSRRDNVCRNIGQFDNQNTFVILDQQKWIRFSRPRRYPTAASMLDGIDLSFVSFFRFIFIFILLFTDKP